MQRRDTMKRKNFWRNWFAVFCGGVGSQTMYVLVINYSMLFFTDFLGIAAGTAGVIFAFSQAWDAINDPMCGALIDKNNSRWGKTQPFMLIGGIITALSLVALFTVPDISHIGKTIWGAAAYNLVGMAFTAVTVSTLVQMPRASKDAKERVNFSVSYSLSCALTGIVVSVIVTKALSYFGKTDPVKGYQTVAIISAVAGLVFLIGNVFLFRDQETVSETSEKPAIKDMIKAIIHTPPFLVLVLAACCSNAGVGISAGALLYYVTYVLGEPEVMQLLLPVTYIAPLISSLSAGYLAKFGKKRMLKISFLLMIAGYLVRVVTGDILLPVTIACYLLSNIGSGYMSNYVLPLLMDCGDYTEYKTGIKCEALTLSGYTLCSKMAVGIGTGLVGFGLQLGGYDGMAAVQSESAVRMISGMHLYPSIILSGVSFVLVFFFKLDEKLIEKIRMKKEEGGM